MALIRPVRAPAAAAEERTWHFDGTLPIGSPDNYVVRAFRAHVERDADGKVVVNDEDTADPLIMRYGDVKGETAPLPGGKTLPLPALMFAISGYFDQKAQERAAQRATAQGAVQ